MSNKQTQPCDFAEAKSLPAFCQVNFADKPRNLDPSALTRESFSVLLESHTSLPSRTSLAPAPSCAVTILNPVLSKNVLVAAFPLEAQSSQTNYAWSFRGKPTAGYFSLTADPEASIANLRGEFSCLIVVDSNNDARVLEWVKHARKINHFPPVIHLKGAEYADLVSEAILPNVESWQAALAGTPIASEHLVELREYRGASEEMLSYEVALITKHLETQKNPPQDLDPRQPWGSLLKPPTAQELMQQCLELGVELITLRKGGTLYAYGIYNPEPCMQPQRSQELGAALDAKQGDLEPCNRGHLALLGVTAEGKLLEKVSGASFYDIIHNHVLNRAKSSGVAELVSEVRVHPFPHTEALSADKARGWKQSGVILPQEIAPGKYAYSEILQLSVRDVKPIRENPLQMLTSRKHIPRRSVTESRETEGLLQELASLVDKTFYLGNPETSREVVSINRSSLGGYRVDYRCWNMAETQVLKQGDYRFAEDFSVFKNEVSYLLKLLREQGREAKIKNEHGRFEDTRALMLAVTMGEIFT